MELKGRAKEEREIWEDPEDRRGNRAAPAGSFLWRHKKPLAILVLVLAVVVMGAVLRSSWARQRELTRQLEAQEEILKALQKAEPEEDEGLVHDAEPVITSRQVNEKLNSLKELVTKEYLYTNADKYENRSQVTIRNWDISLPLTGKSFLLAYDGRIKAGVDLSQAEIQVDEARKTVTVTLPASEILSHEIFEDQIRVFDEKDSLFNKITIDNYNEFVAEQKGVMEQKAVDMGLLSEADREARGSVSAFLGMMPGMDSYWLDVR